MGEKMLPALLERGTEAPTTISKTDHSGGRPQQSPLCVIDASERTFTRRLSAAAEEGAWVLITNVENNLSCMDIVHSLQSQTRNHPDPSKTSQSLGPSDTDNDVLEQSLCSPSHAGDVPITQKNDAPSSFQLFFSTHLPLSTFVEEVGPDVLKYVNVIDMSLGYAGLEEELVKEILLLKDARLQEERRRLELSALQLEEDIQKAQDTLLDYVWLGARRLLEREDFPDKASSCEETQRLLQESLGDVATLQQQIEENVAPYVSAAQHCLFLYSRLQAVSRLSPQYHFPAGSIVCWARQALRTHVDMGLKVEKVLTRSILTRVLPGLTEEHRQILRVLLAVGQPPALEWLSFLGLMHKSVQETSSSCIQRPRWVDSQAWEELGQLEKLSSFQGIRSSLSAQARQWQEYFNLRSTVIGPVPCSNFSHLSLFQTAILWRILKPENLGLVLTHLTSCILGPEPTDRCEEEADIITLSDPHSPVLFLLPRAGPSPPPYHPMYHILHLAKKRAKEVKVITWRESLPERDVRDTLTTSQREGHWLLLIWHPKLADLLKTGGASAMVNPEFRLCIILQEETLLTIPVCVRGACWPAPSIVRSDLRDVLLQSCLEAAEDVGEQMQSPVSGKLLILHSVLLLRQEYSRYVQSDTYSWSQEDLKDALRALQRVTLVCQDWEEALRFITGAVIYGGHILDEGDAHSVMAVVQQCLQDQAPHRGSRGLSTVLSTLPAGRSTGSWINGVQWSLRKICSMWEPSALGLSEGLHNTTMEVYGNKVLSNLLITQDVWTSKANKPIKENLRSSIQGDQKDDLRRCTPEHEATCERTFSGSTCSPRSGGIGENSLSQCLALLMELRDIQVAQQRELDTRYGLQEDQHEAQPETHDDHEQDTGQNVEEQNASTMERQKEAKVNEKPKRWREAEDMMDGHSQKWPALKKPHPLLRFVLEEWHLLCGLIKQAIEELRDVGSPCRCWRCQEIRKTLSVGYVPTWWNVYSLPFPVTAMSWVQGLQVRVKCLSAYISESSPFNITYNLSVFRHPARLLHSLLQERGLQDHTELEAYSLHVQVSDRTPPPLDRVAISLAGIHLKHALWDTRLALLQETLSPKLCTLPVLWVSAVRGNRELCRRSVTSHYICPVYSSEAPEGHNQHQQLPVLLLPLPSNIPPCVWSQRRVHAVSLL